MDNDNSTMDLPVLDPALTAPTSPYSKAFLWKLLDLFITQIPQTEAAIIKAFNQKRQKTLEQLLHSLQGACIYCGLVQLQHIITGFKANIKEGKFLRNQLQQLRVKLHQITQVRDEL